MGNFCAHIKKQHVRIRLKSYILFEEYYPLGYNAVQSVQSQPTFRRKI
jgi:hypothetical protein